MENLPNPQTILTRNDALRTLLGVAVGALEAELESLTEVKLVILELRKGLHRMARAGRTERTRYLALTATALEEAEGWLHKAQMED